MPRTRYIYLDTPPPALAPPHAPAQQVVAFPPPLAPGDLGWPQQTPPQGLALPGAAPHGTTQIVYVPMPTSALAPQHLAPVGQPASSMTGCLLTAVGVLVVAVCLMALLLVPPATRAQLGDRMQQVVQIVARAPESTADMPPAADTAAAAAPDTADAPAPDVAAVPPAADRTFRYDNLPSISRDQYIALWCAADSPACPEAGAMFDAIVHGGIDPAFELVHAWKETGYGMAGVGRATVGRNLHGVRCNNWDGAGCVDGHSAYATYTESVRAWVQLMTTQGIYIDAGHTTPDTIIPIYCPPVECNTALYIEQFKDKVTEYRQLAPAAPAQAPAAESPAASGTHTAASARVAAAVQGSTRAGDTTEIALVLTTHAPGLVLGRESLVVTDASGQRYRLDTDTSPVTLPQGAAQLTLLVPAPADARLTLTLTFAPDPPLALDVSAD